MQLITDTREQDSLTFSTIEGVEYVRECLPCGDYGARINGEMVKAVWERKSIADLFSSFSSNYENEKAKIERAKELGWIYMLAIEGNVFDVREGHTYTKGGEVHHSKKSGIAQIRQLLTMYQKEYLDLWFFDSRAEMAFTIQEYFLNIKKKLADGLSLKTGFDCTKDTSKLLKSSS